MNDIHDEFEKALGRKALSNDRNTSSTEAIVEFSEDALAEEFSQRHKDNLRYVNQWGRWLIWDGRRWKHEETLQAQDLAREIVREAAIEHASCGNTPRQSGQIASAKTVSATERLARADRRHASTVDEWDKDCFLLNTPGGTVDLRNGNHYPHQQGDMITKITEATPGGECPKWMDFLDQIFDSDQGLIKYIQRMVGYCLSGSTKEHALFFLFGTGGNGKSVFLNTIAGILGDYSRTAPMEMFAASRNERHPTDLASLKGARLVCAQETEQGQRWAESKIKALTGGDTITARFMRQDSFEFAPEFKLVVSGNQKPAIRNIDDGIRRRIHLVPFTVTISGNRRNPNLEEELRKEWPGILAWAIEGYLEWQKIGLAPPPAVQDATSQHLIDEDAIGRFISERCDLGDMHKDHFEEVGELFDSWCEWCERNGEYKGSMKRFSQDLEARKLEKCKQPSSRRSCFRGIKLLVKSMTRESD